MALIDVEPLATDPVFLSRVKAALVAAAIAVQTEDPQTPNHAQRARFAAAVLHQTDRVGPKVAWGVASNPTILGQGEAGSSDGDIEFVISGVWDAYASAS